MGRTVRLRGRGGGQGKKTKTGGKACKIHTSLQPTWQWNISSCLWLLDLLEMWISDWTDFLLPWLKAPTWKILESNYHLTVFFGGVVFKLMGHFQVATADFSWGSRQITPFGRMNFCFTFFQPKTNLSDLSEWSVYGDSEREVLGWPFLGISKAWRSKWYGKYTCR